MLSLTFSPSPIGTLTLLADEDFLIIADFFDTMSESEIRDMLEKRFSSSISFQKNPILLQTEKQLDEYFSGRRQAFSVPLALSGTDFQKRSWDALCAIPYGETRSYGEQASSSGNPRASRAVGGANNKNPILILIPCHRVIASDGGLGGYRGGLDRKQYLLDLERRLLAR